MRIKGKGFFFPLLFREKADEEERIAISPLRDTSQEHLFPQKIWTEKNIFWEKIYRYHKNGN